MLAAPVNTLWYLIDVFGNPSLPGWYECLYEGDEDDDEPERLYFDGAVWLCKPGGIFQCNFGSGNTTGERWRGARTPHGGYYV